MLNYLYYKLYQASLRSSLYDIPEFLTPVFLGGLVSANIIVISALLAKMDILPFLFSNKAQGVVFVLVVIITALFYFRKKRIDKIMNLYSPESESKRKIGNLIISLYVAISFVMLFAIAFFRPGQL